MIYRFTGNDNEDTGSHSCRHAGFPSPLGGEAVGSTCTTRLKAGGSQKEQVFGSAEDVARVGNKSICLGRGCPRAL